MAPTSAPGNSIAYVGTSPFAVPPLRALAALERRRLSVWTRPPHPSRRGRTPQETAVGQEARRLDLPLRHLRHFDEETLAEFSSFAPDLLVAVSFGILIPPALLEIPSLGCVNLHASLLPLWRGAAPIERALMAGDRETGVTLMRMNAGLDSGPILRQRTLEIGELNAAELESALARQAADLLLKALPSILDGSAQERDQEHGQATWAEKIERKHARIDWRQNAAAISRQIRALVRGPKAETELGGEQLFVANARPEPLDGSGRICPPPSPPGTVLETPLEGPLIATAQGSLRLLKIQTPGRPEVEAGPWFRSRRLRGRRLGPSSSAKP